MATVNAPGNLQTAQTGDADSTNTILDAKAAFVDTGRPATVRIVSAVGATPTVTVDIQGSEDESTGFANIPYATAAAPTTYVSAPLVITTATTSYYRLQPGRAWRYAKLVMSANTNVTLTSDYS